MMSKGQMMAGRARAAVLLLCECVVSVPRGVYCWAGCVGRVGSACSLRERLKTGFLTRYICPFIKDLSFLFHPSIRYPSRSLRVRALAGACSA